MKTCVALIGIIVENYKSVDALNDILHENRHVIIGRLGIPHREKKLSVMSIVLDSDDETVKTLDFPSFVNSTPLVAREDDDTENILHSRTQSIPSRAVISSVTTRLLPFTSSTVLFALSTCPFIGSVILTKAPCLSDDSLILSMVAKPST